MGVNVCKAFGIEDIDRAAAGMRLPCFDLELPYKELNESVGRWKRLLLHMWGVLGMTDNEEMWGYPQSDTVYGDISAKSILTKHPLHTYDKRQDND